MKMYFSFFIALFLTCFFTLIVLIPSAYSGVLGKTPETLKEKTSSFFGGSTNNQTVVNVESSPDQDLAANDEKVYEEATHNFTGDFPQVIVMSSMGGRQVSPDSFTIGYMYKLNEHWQGGAEYLTLNSLSIENVKYKSVHALAFIGIRYTIAMEYQLQFNGGLSMTSEITRNDNEGSGDVVVGDYDTPVFGEIKFLWCSDNTAYGVKYQMIDIPNKAEKEEDYRNFGHSAISFNFEVAFGD